MNRQNVYFLIAAMACCLLLVAMKMNRPAIAPVVNAIVLHPIPVVHAATTSPSTLPEEFSILLTHNPFAHGHGAAAGANVAEKFFVVKGVGQADACFTVFIEDQTAKKITQVAVGDAVARGKIKSIDLDAIQYEVAGNSRRIEIGQNLNGEVVAASMIKPTTLPAASEETTPPNPQSAVVQPGQS